MKLSKLILTLMFAMLLTTCLTGRPIHGGFGGFSYTGMYSDYTNLNQYLTNAGLPAISNSLYFNEDGPVMPGANSNMTLSSPSSLSAKPGTSGRAPTKLIVPKSTLKS